MNTTFAKKALAATLGVATVLSLSVAATPAFAKGGEKSSKSRVLVQEVRKGGKALKLGSAVEQGNEHSASVKTTDLAFTISGVPAIPVEEGATAKTNCVGGVGLNVTWPVEVNKKFWPPKVFE